MKHTFKLGKKAIALLLALVMTLSVFSIVGFAEDGDEPEAPAGPFTVTFYASAEGPTGLPPVIKTQTVNAGEAATAPTEAEMANLIIPAEDSMGPRFVPTFDHWDKDFSNVISDMKIYPVFAGVPKTYTIIYKNWDGTELNREDCAYGAKPGYASTPSRNDEPLRYFYEFGQWALKANIDLQKTPDDSKYLLNWQDGFILPDFNKNPTEPDTFASEITVYPYFIRHKVEYVASFTVVDAYGAPVDNAAIQVRSASGQLMEQTEAAVDENGVSTGKLKPATGRTNSNGELVMRLPYETKYTVDASHETLGAISKEVSYGELHALTLQLQPVSTVDKEGGERCTDICHSFLGGLWITGLNLMYYLFKVKYVCCFDMYATHGSRLAYAA